MIVYDLDDVWPSISPNETDAVPDIDSDAVLTFAITRKSF